MDAEDDGVVPLGEASMPRVSGAGQPRAPRPAGADPFSLLDAGDDLRDLGSHDDRDDRGRVLPDGRPGTGDPRSPEAAADAGHVGAFDAGHVGAFDGGRWVEEVRPVPRAGWRRGVYRLSGGRVNPGPDAHELEVRRWVQEIRRPFGGARTVAVVSTKGGVGKTTTTVGLGHALAHVRGDRVVALDANPDAGSLAYRVLPRPSVTAADLLAEAAHVATYADIRRFTAQASSNLEVVASPDDPRITRRMGRVEYEQLLGLLRSHYNLVLADCGTGILDGATRGVVQGCDQLVVVTGPSVDAARSVTYLLDWLRAHHMEALVAEALVVVNAVRPGRRPVDLEGLEAHFAEQVRAVVRVPFDDELANGAAVELDWLASPTRQAYTRLAAAVVDGLTTSHTTRADMQETG